MDDPDDRAQARKGKLSAFALLKSWLFSKSEPEPARAETEFLNTRDGVELARFAKEAFGGDADARQRAQDEAVAAEQAEIDALLQGTGAVPMPTPAPIAPAVVATAPAAVAAAHAVQPVAAAAAAATPAAPAAAASQVTVDAAVAHLEVLRVRGFSVEMLAEALIVIESRDVKRRATKAA